MKAPLTIDEVIQYLPRPRRDAEAARLFAPPFSADPERERTTRLGLTTGSMLRHMTDEGGQIFQGLECAGYTLVGHEVNTVTDRLITANWTTVPDIMKHFQPKTVVLQDRREWEGLTADRSRDPAMIFHGIEALRDDHSCFKVSILKDAQHNPGQHRIWFDDMGCHAFVHYYNARIVSHLAPYLRPQHMIRTWHTVNSDLVPPFNPDRRHGCLLSGARNRRAYPLRERLWRGSAQLPDAYTMDHPGYHRRGCCTPDYLKTLSNFKVAICTSSIYGYTLRKIIEATACGCVVISDLPSDEVIPGIDQNIIRVRGCHDAEQLETGCTVEEMADLLREQYARWNPERQEWFATTAKGLYDFRSQGYQLANDIETMRNSYHQSAQVEATT